MDLTVFFPIFNLNFYVFAKNLQPCEHKSY